MKTVDDIVTPDHTLLLPFGRDRLLQFLPKRGRVAEIGVYKSRFSRKILRQTRPHHLDLIDAWDIDVDGKHIPHHADHRKDSFARLPKILPWQLKIWSPTSNIATHVGLSAPMAEKFPDKSFDWIYVDADHSYKGVFADLTAWGQKIRDDGLIIGHDFTNQPSAIADGFGVIEAVRDFCFQRGFHLLAITTDYFPTFVLSRPFSTNVGKCEARHVIERIIRSQKSIIRLPSVQVFRVHHNRFAREGTRTGILSDYR